VLILPVDANHQTLFRYADDMIFNKRCTFCCALFWMFDNIPTPALPSTVIILSQFGEDRLKINLPVTANGIFPDGSP
jgi:hypothetical protein